MAERKGRAIRILRIKKGDDLKTIYAKARKAFTAEDLQRYTEIEEDGVPGDQLVAELEAIHREELAKQRRKKKK
jgi:hypothetical protein